MPMETPRTQAGARTARARRIAKLFPSVPRRDWAGLVMTFVIPCGVPLLLAVAMGIPLAVLIVKGQFHLVFAFLLLIPSVVLFNTYPLAALIIWLLLAPFCRPPRMQPIAWCTGWSIGRCRWRRWAWLY